MTSFRTLALAGVAAAMLVSTHVSADDFRIETKVYLGKEKQPASQNTTLFHAGRVYDYLSNPARVAVFDQPHGRFILLDPERRLKTEVKTTDVLTFSNKFHEWAAGTGNAFMNFAADPDFEVEFSEDGVLSMKSPYIQYDLVTEPAEATAAGQYREFSDWYARFNAMAHVGSTPPFPRLAVNDELFRRGLVAREVQLTIPAQATLGVRSVSMRSEHHVSWRLLQRDLSRIAETANHLTTFRQVDFSEFEPNPGDKLSKR